MGNLIQYQNSSNSVFEVIPNLLMLTKCKTHAGAKQDILKIYKNYVFYISKNFYISRSELKRLSRHTNIEGIEDLIFVYFLRPSLKKINIMELLAGIIIYSYID